MKSGKLSTALGLRIHKCVNCGKTFECSVDYVYKRTKPNSRGYFNYLCSYSCLREYDKTHENKRKRRA